jgi:hypothetical protein
MKRTQFIMLAAIVGLCMPARGEVISYTMGIDVNCPSGLSE